MSLAQRCLVRILRGRILLCIPLFVSLLLFASLSYQPQTDGSNSKILTIEDVDNRLEILQVKDVDTSVLRQHTEKQIVNTVATQKVTVQEADILSHIKKNSKLTGVLIHTAPRSGSNFVFSIFQSHPKTLWKPEPFVCVHEKTKLLNYDIYPMTPGNNVCAKQGALFLQGLFTCESPNLDLANCSKGYELDCNEQFKKAFLKCGLKNKSPRWCLKYFTHTIVKENLRAAPAYLDEFAMAITEEIRVVHLIRDPRSRAQSMKRNHQLGRRAPLEKFRTILDRDCNTTMRDVKFGLKYMKPKNLYELFRYEDTCYDLEKQTKRIMKFSGLEYVEGVKQFVNKTLSVKSVTHEQLRHLYNTDRVVHDQIYKWRTIIEPDLLKVVEESPACQEMMKFFGYKPVGEDIATLRNTSIPLYDFKKFVSNF